jgi:hypothetical protein
MKMGRNGNISNQTPSYKRVNTVKAVQTSKIIFSTCTVNTSAEKTNYQYKLPLPVPVPVINYPC